MTRSPLHRFFGALLALWLVVFTTQPAALHACPVHDGPAAAHGGGSAGHAGHAGHSAHAAMASHSEQAPASQHASSQICSCPGSCCTVAPVELPRIESSTIASIVAVSDPGLPEYAYVAVSRALVLPFANGPPRA